MPRHTHLLRGGSQYYVNVRVPRDLRGVVGKDIVRRSLHTSDPREAVRRVHRKDDSLALTPICVGKNT
jgi:hypothetical protein